MIVMMFLYTFVVYMDPYNSQGNAALKSKESSIKDKLAYGAFVRLFSG